MKIGVVGTGRMGSIHALDLLGGRVAGAELVAVCDRDPEALGPFSGVPRFLEADRMLRSGSLEAVLIATPHDQHASIAIDALGLGLHVLVEKPLSAHARDCARMLAAYRRRPDPSRVFGEVLSLRADPRYRELERLLAGKALGRVGRISWVVTDRFRTEAYYRSRPWRGTWAGAGGGVLLNQCPHHLDVWQWLFGMPRRVRAFCELGRFHEIEVEDQVTAFFEQPDGASGVFVASTGEAPGTNRLEVAGDLGKIVLENGRLEIFENARESSRHRREEAGGAPQVQHRTLEVLVETEPRLRLLENFVAACRGLEPLLAPASEGIFSVELANAAIQSSVDAESVDLPLDPERYLSTLNALIAGEPPSSSHPVGPSQLDLGADLHHPLGGDVEELGRRLRVAGQE